MPGSLILTAGLSYAFLYSLVYDHGCHMLRIFLIGQFWAITRCNDFIFFKLFLFIFHVDIL
jgi:hypothetical protein